MMKKRCLMAMLLAVAVTVCGCGAEQEPSAETSVPSTQSAEEIMLETKFKNAEAILNEYLQTGAVLNADGINEVEGMSDSQVLGMIYHQFLDAAEHPQAEQYLNRFLVLEDVPQALVGYLSDGREFIQNYEYDSDGRMTREPKSENVYYQYYYSYNGELNLVRCWDGTQCRYEYRINYEEPNQIQLVKENIFYPYEQILVYQFEDGKVVSAKESGEDSHTILYTYDGERLVLKKEQWGRPEDGGIDLATTEYIYDADGNLGEKVYEFSHLRYVLNDQGEFLCETEELYERICSLYEYDADGKCIRLTEKTEQNNWDSGKLIYTSESTRETEYSYQNDRLISEKQSNIEMTYIYGNYYCYIEQNIS